MMVLPAVLLGALQPAQARDWLLVAVSMAGHHHFIDPASRVHQDPIRIAWFRIDARADATAGFAEKLQQTAYDCHRAHHAELAFVALGADGAALASRDWDYRHWQAVTPGSVEEKRLRHVCD